MKVVNAFWDQNDTCTKGHRRKQNHKIHHMLILGGITIFFFVIYYVAPNRDYTKVVIFLEYHKW